jgi:hypothetical protein
MGKLYFLTKNLCFFSAVKRFPIFGHQNPGSGSVFSLKCWIRIRIKGIRIGNTGFIIRLSAILMGVPDPTVPTVPTLKVNHVMNPISPY